MSSVRTRSRWLAAIAPGLTTGLMAGLLALPLAASAQVYKWVDENGVTHYTLERQEIPPHLRQRLRPIAPGALPPPGPPEPTTRLSSAPSTQTSAPVPRPDHTAEILSLEEQIAADRETLKDLISQQRDAGEFAQDPKVQEIAERLPRLQAQLAELRRESGP